MLELPSTVSRYHYDEVALTNDSAYSIALEDSCLVVQDLLPYGVEELHA